MNDFSDFVGSGFDESSGVFGIVKGSLLGKPIEGTLDMEQLDRSLALDGEKASTPGTYMVAKKWLNGIAKPWTRTLDNLIITIGSAEYRIEKIMVDEANVTFVLDDPHR